MKILVTGGAGYIGSHTCVELLNTGYEIVVIDNLRNSNKQSLRRVQEITGEKLQFHKMDIHNKKDLRKIFSKYKFSAVIHFAGFKAVGESVEKPLLYYKNNVSGSIVLAEVMRDFGVNNIVFSSSATVYGDPLSVPIKENFPVKPTNPYGYSKLMIEQIFSDIHTSDNSWNVILLRYFNPVGAHESGKIGEDPNDIPTNLMPYISQVAVGKLDKLHVFGDDYPTKDGTGIRDYIHVVDLSIGHLHALDKLEQNPGVVVYNLGTGEGYSVFDMISAYEKVSGKTIPYDIIDRRPGDIAKCFADPSKAERELNWKAKRGIKAMCRDAWHWQNENPNGYENF